MNSRRYIRIAIIVLIIELVCSVCAFAESAYRVDDDVFYYEYSYEGRLAIVGIDSDSDTVNIPKEIYGSTVRAIGNGNDPIHLNKDFDKIICPNSVELIDYNAFAVDHKINFLDLGTGIKEIRGEGIIGNIHKLAIRSKKPPKLDDFIISLETSVYVVNLSKYYDAGYVSWGDNRAFHISAGQIHPISDLDRNVVKPAGIAGAIAVIVILIGYWLIDRKRRPAYRKKIFTSTKGKKSKEKIKLTGKQADYPKGKLFDSARMRWDGLMLNTRWAPRVCKVIVALIVSAAVYMLLDYGMTFKPSLLSVFVNYFLNEYSTRLPLYLSVITFLVSLASEKIGYIVVLLIAVSSMLGIQPVLMGIALFLMIIALSGSSIAVACYSMLPIALVTNVYPNVNCSMMLFAIIMYASIRLEDKTRAVIASIVFALLSICTGVFGHLIKLGKLNKEGLPKAYWYTRKGIGDNWNGGSLGFKEKASDLLRIDFDNIIAIVAVLVIVAILFVLIATYKRGKYGKLHIDIRDGIAFVALFVMIIAFFNLVPVITIAGEKSKETIEWKIDYFSLFLQILLAYIITRPIALRTPNEYRTNKAIDGEDFIFISYAYADKRAIMPYLAELDNQGYRYWYDTSIKAGSEWQDVIATNLANSSFVLAFISPSSAASEYCTKEINYATSKNKPFGAIYLRDTKLSPVLEMHMASIHALKVKDYTTVKDCIDELLKLEGIAKCKNFEEETK